MLDNLLTQTDVKPVINQIELHPSFQQASVSAATSERGIVVQAYSPMARGSDLSDPVVVGIADTLGKTPAQVILRWHIENGTNIIPKTTNKERMKENLALFDFSLTPEQHQAITSLEAGASMGHDPLTYSYS
jgi:diketogulonate reductase-like aldo/keto reductase